MPQGSARLHGVMPPDLCQHCHQRPATEQFSEAGGSLDFVHGQYQRWCRHCVVAAQLRHAKDCAERVPALEAELAKLP